MERVAALPLRSRKPGGARRAGQRSADRRVPTTTVPVMPPLVLEAFQRRWRGCDDRTWPWRRRGLAVLAAAMSVPPGTTVTRLCAMTPTEVLQLRMPFKAWTRVVRWLEVRRELLGDESDGLPWLSYHGSRGMPRQMCWAAMRTLQRAGIPGWRLRQLVRTTWHPGSRVVPFASVARSLVGRQSPLRSLVHARRWDRVDEPGLDVPTSQDVPGR